MPNRCGDVSPRLEITIGKQEPESGELRENKLQPKELKTIRALPKTTEVSVQGIATRFGVSRSTLYRDKLT